MTQIVLSAPGGDLTVHGSRAAGSPSLLRDGLQLPQPQPVVDYASAKWINGDLPVSVRTPNAVLGLQVRVEGATEAAHQAILANFNAALLQLDYTATVTLGDAVTAWRAMPGTIALRDGQRLPVTAGEPVVDYYTITIPVYPVGG